MRLSTGGNIYRNRGLALAGAFLYVLLHCTPAHNQTYRYTDSKGVIHFRNISLPEPPIQEARRSPWPENKEKTVSPAAQPTPDSSADLAGGVSRMIDKQGTIQITNAAQASPLPKSLPAMAARRQIQATPAGNRGEAAGTASIPSAGEAQNRVQALIANSAGAGAQVSRPDPATASLNGVTGANAKALNRSDGTAVYTALVSPAQAEHLNGINPMALFIDQQGKMYCYHPQVAAGDDSFWDAPIISWEKTASPSPERAAAVKHLAAQVQPGPMAPVAHTHNSSQLSRQAINKSLAAPPGKIRIYRDGRGCMHIVNSPGVNNSFAAKRLPEPTIATIAGARQTPQTNLSAVMLPPGTSKIIPDRPQGLDNGFSRIVSFKDKNGRLIVCNKKAGEADSPASGLDPVALGGRAHADLETLMAGAAQQYRLPLPLVKAVVRAESGFVPQAVSWKGAMGLMQLMPATAACLGVKDPFCPQENIMGGCRYLRDLLDKLNGSVPLSLAAYNAGLQRVINAGYEIPAIAETRNYVDKVIKYFFIYLQENLGGRNELI